MVLVLALAVGGLAIAGVFKSSSHRKLQNSLVAQHRNTPVPATSTTGSSTKGGTSAGGSAQTATYNGKAFSVQYPSGWMIKSAEQQHSWGTDTTIVSPSNAQTLLRVDVSPNVATSDPLTSAQSEINQVSKESGYQELALSSNTFAGLPGEYWEFLVNDSGVSEHTVDQFLIDRSNGDGIAILTQAPGSEWSSLSSEFAKLRNSLSIH